MASLRPTLFKMLDEGYANSPEPVVSLHSATHGLFHYRPFVFSSRRRFNAEQVKFSRERMAPTHHECFGNTVFVLFLRSDSTSINWFLLAFLLIPAFFVPIPGFRPFGNDDSHQETDDQISL